MEATGVGASVDFSFEQQEGESNMQIHMNLDEKTLNEMEENQSLFIYDEARGTEVEYRLVSIHQNEESQEDALGEEIDEMLSEGEMMLDDLISDAVKQSCEQIIPAIIQKTLRDIFAPDRSQQKWN